MASTPAAPAMGKPKATCPVRKKGRDVGFRNPGQLDELGQQHEKGQGQGQGQPVAVAHCPDAGLLSLGKMEKHEEQAGQKKRPWHGQGSYGAGPVGVQGLELGLLLGRDAFTLAHDHLALVDVGIDRFHGPDDLELAGLGGLLVENKVGLQERPDQGEGRLADPDGLFDVLAQQQVHLVLEPLKVHHARAVQIEGLHAGGQLPQEDPLLIGGKHPRVRSHALGVCLLEPRQDLQVHEILELLRTPQEYRFPADFRVQVFRKDGAEFFQVLVLLFGLGEDVDHVLSDGFVRGGAQIEDRRLVIRHLLAFADGGLTVFVAQILVRGHSLGGYFAGQKDLHG